MDEKNRIENRIGVLDGIRAIAIGMVVWFHFWQQTWLTPYLRIPTEYTKYIGLTEINLAGWVRYGFVFVDMMILLSAFCNFYPYARSIVLGEDWPDTKKFYRKRAARILPSYYFMLTIDLFFYILPGHKYRNVGALCKDIVTHVFCVAPKWSDTYISTSFNGVLWTVQMEVIYYLLLPWIARLFRKWAFATYSVMLMISVTSTAVILNCFAGKERNYGNNILTFMGIYANGMLCCILHVMWKKYVTENKYSRLAGTVISVLCIFLMNGMIHKYDGDVNLQAVKRCTSRPHAMEPVRSSYGSDWFQTLRVHALNPAAAFSTAVNGQPGNRSSYPHPPFQVILLLYVRRIFCQAFGVSGLQGPIP